jgi:nucleotide-binding universal stress UspA family protein
MAFTRILVALDGSRLAEAVLPAACSLAGTLGARLALVHVLEREPPATVHGEPHLADAPEATAYLEPLADQLRRQGITVEVHVHERPVGDVAAALDRHAHELGADLIAMCAHGRTNLRSRLVGSIAERILRGGGPPILLRTVRRPGDASFALRNLLVPIDFVHDVETALSATRTLAVPYGATVVLLAALEPDSPGSSRLLPATSAVMRGLDFDGLARRLAAMADDLRPELREVRTIVDQRRPADAIIAASEELPADLIVLVTDAHGRLSRWFDPSAAQRLLARPDLMLLLIKEL